MMTMDTFGRCLQIRVFQNTTIYFLCAECLDLADNMTPEQRETAFTELFRNWEAQRIKMAGPSLSKRIHPHHAVIQAKENPPKADLS